MEALGKALQVLRSSAHRREFKEFGCNPEDQTYRHLR